MEHRELVDMILQILEQKKADRIEEISVTQKTTLADTFVVCSGSSTTQVHSLADELQYQIGQKAGIKPQRVEGQESNKWLLLDYGSVIVHIFNQDERDFYDLDNMWHDLQIQEDIVK